MLALLLAGGVAYLLLGDLTEALILLAFATFSVAVIVVQESRTETVLEALCDLSAPRALVIRDGAQVRIAGREVVQKRDAIMSGKYFQPLAMTNWFNFLVFVIGVASGGSFPTRSTSRASAFP